MKLAVRVKPGSRRDGLWREGDGLYATIRGIPQDGAANTYLIEYLSGSLRVAKSLITVVRGFRSNHKLINVEADEADLRPILDALELVPQASLFEPEK